ncbi:hypothetical protein FGO68_gene4687 [Halteria grandinella]|uniref:Uncharacterized protein n=1 Tax=Halteria grandinella TaxID=5974 RepID=A0A8J8SUV6_HALGN|nr:hypothetical protein FGO68_gene4687 [Halteria grandinella]
MDQKIIALILTIAQCGTIVNVSDECICQELQSRSDCRLRGCKWTADEERTEASCETAHVKTYTAYCPGLTTCCASTYGCANVDSKCTHFAGCSAYVKTSTTECQAISYLCISNGTTCTDAKECKDYDSTICDATPDMYKRKCKYDTTCRSYACTEADAATNSNSACDAFSAGCVTTGAGCVISPLPTCALLPGTDTSCPNMTGSDGKCKFVSGTTCALKLCSDFPTGTPTDSDCVAFQSFCLKSTGKGCVAALDKCSSYTVANAATDCAGYMGTDGTCEGDANATACRARKCENGTGTTDEACNTYKSGCVTNGVKCVDARSKCSDYTGTSTTCLNYIGSDGKCKGASTTSAACSLRDCDADSKATYTTDALCQNNIQSYCYSNGAGCTKTLAKCNTYSYTSTDGAECNSKIGSDGRCKVGTSGKCASRVCTDAPTSTTTTDACVAYQTGCVTTGAGCVAATSCNLTVKEKSCSSTIETGSSVVCNWNAICVNNTSCGNYNTPSLCAGYKITVTSGTTSTQYPCIWDGTCRRAVCTDYTGTSYANDTACDNALTGCVYNGVSGCVTPTCSNFKGIKATCLGFKAYCTNTDAAAATEVCIARTCADTGLTYTTDNDCTNYLTGCLTNGNGCIANTATCSQYTGTPDVCDKFYGYYGSTVQGARCWNTSATSGACTEKQCSHATGMSQDSDCDTFLKGCLYNGNGGCVTASASCGSYTGSSTATCSAFKGSSGANQCWWTSGSTCVAKACSHDTTSTTDGDCGTFLTGCVTKGTGCTDPTSTCPSYSGTAAQCNSFTYKPASGNAIKCTRLESCTVRTCSTKTDAASNNDCLSYHNTCRITYGSAVCLTEQALCTSYTLTGSDDTAKTTYCNQITLRDNTTLCGYKSTVSGTCSARSCDMWTSAISGTTCVDYLGTATCRLSSNSISNCYAANTCANYVVPTSLTATGDKVTWCNNMLDNSTPSEKCTYASGANCVDITTCEQIPSPTNAASCNAYLLDDECQFYNGKCYTTQTACTSYSLTGITTQAAYCAALKQDNSGAIGLCKYLATTTANCVTITCSEIASPTSQTSCDLSLSGGCTYYAGVCYTKAACVSINTPTGASDDAKLLFCQNMFDVTTTDYCTWASGTTCAAPAAACTNQAIPVSVATKDAYCQARRNKAGSVCKYVDSTSTTACQDYDSGTAAEICTLVPGTVDSDAYCDLRTNVGYCVKSESGSTCIARAACTDQTHGLAASATDDAKAAACQLLKGPTGLSCTFITTETNCNVGKANCAAWSSLTGDQRAFCSARTDQSGKKCAFDLGASTCRDYKACEGAVSPQSKADCDALSSGCKYFSGTCYVPAASCGAYLAVGSDDTKKLTYCNGLKDTQSTPVACTFIKGQTRCSTKGACNTYTVSGLADDAARTAACSAIATSDTNGCTFWPGVAATCTAVGACSTYTGGSAGTAATNCAVQKDTTGLTCIANANGTDCAAPANCEAITTPGSQADCNKYKSGCIYSSSKCYTLGGCTSYSTGGSGAIALCKGLRATSLTGDFCTASTDADANCAARTCGDVSYTTHAQCAAYLSGCKSNGSTCIAGSTTCALQSGNPSQCQFFQDTDGISSCIDTTASTTAASCISRTCSQNVTATTDSECDSYLAGCLTDGLGCIAGTEPCASYYGTTSVCKAFTGNSKKCWGTSDTVTGACRDRTCADNTTATSDSECESFLTGCLTTGAGCISKTSGCSAYKGTQDDCSKFKGLSGTVLCYNTSAATATTACKDRACTDLAGTSDTDCAAFMPAASATAAPNCVTNGTNCVAYPKNCADFKGTETTCPKFTAYDGPCKTTTYTTTPAACTPRVCTEAPNTTVTDTDCHKYHPTCVTTGYGCAKEGIECGDVQTQSACWAKIECLWANKCTSAPTSCSELTSYRICVNTLLANKTKCAWTGTACRSHTIEDYDDSFTTHEKCNDADNTCTTDGAGCVKMGPCSSYKTSATCAAATSTEKTKRCQWAVTETATECRPRECSDGYFTTNDECNTFLAGCKTNGITCFGHKYDCSEFTGQQKYCLQDSTGYPCLYVGGVCYNYAECGDAAASTLTGCQAYNSLCVPTSTAYCLAQTSCDKYTEQQSCTVGISNSVCGWLTATSKCQVFGACSDSAATSNSDCAFYGSKCITDGTKCVETGKCDSYLTSTSCGNLGTDGACTWVAASNTCRLRQCGDKVATTDSDCSSYTVTTGVCTTDGTTCVARAACTAYATETACTIGSDAIPCIWALPVGSTTGTKSCRQKECSDIVHGITNELCIGQISGKSCVSNGKSCVEQDKCANYQNKISCNGDGTDGICAFTAAATTADPQAGTCVQFSSCDKASSDQTTCAKKSSACQWTSTTSGTTTTTSCTAKTCAQAASGTTCNPVPSFDGKSYTVCALSSNVCTASDPSVLTSTTCYTKSVYTYTWNDSTSKCVSCTGSTTPTNNSTNGNTTNNNSNGTTTTNGYILGVSIPLVIMGLFA